MLQDSTIAKGKLVPVIRLRPGKKISRMNMKMKRIENAHPLRELSFQRRCQQRLHTFFTLSLKDIESIKEIGF
jgi:hypothetical protein